MDTQLQVQTTQEKQLQEFANKWYDKEVIISEDTVERLTESQISYLWLGYNKERVFSSLEKKELKCQQIITSILKEIENRGGEATVELAIIIEEGLNQYVKAYNEMEGPGDAKGENKGIALRFRNWVYSILTEPTSEFGRRCNPKTNEDYKYAKDALLSIKENLEKEHALRTAKDEEKRMFVAHVNNENIRRVAELKISILENILEVKKDLLEKERKPNVANIKKIAKESEVFKLKDASKFERKYLTEQDALSLVNNMEHPDENALAQELDEMIDEEFSTFEQDLNLKKNNPTADVTKALEEKISKLRDDLEVNINVNNFVASSSAVPEVTKHAFSAIKRKLYIECENSDEWEMKLLAVCLKHFYEIKPFISDIKEKCNRKDQQRVDAIGKLATEKGIKFPEFEYKEDKR